MNSSAITRQINAYLNGGLKLDDIDDVALVEFAEDGLHGLDELLDLAAAH